MACCPPSKASSQLVISRDRARECERASEQTAPATGGGPRVHSSCSLGAMCVLFPAWLASPPPQALPPLPPSLYELGRHRLVRTAAAHRDGTAGGVQGHMRMPVDRRPSGAVDLGGRSCSPLVTSGNQRFATPLRQVVDSAAARLTQCLARHHLLAYRRSRHLAGGRAQRGRRRSSQPNCAGGPSASLEPPS